jgi:DNA-binding NarL/FixJ family response regulator
LGAPEALERGRDCYQRGVWKECHRLLSIADQASPLGCDDLEYLANATFLIGRNEENAKLLDRLHRASVDSADWKRATRCAAWLALRLLIRGETGHAAGWLARGRRLLERLEPDCLEHGYLLVPAAEQELAACEWERAYATATHAARIADSFADQDLSACARHLQGRARMQQGGAQEGLALLDEVMLAVTAGELSPIITGLLFGNVIECCRRVYAWDRAREWTNAFTRWCEKHSDLVAFTDVCSMHRAVVLHLKGEWTNAIEQARVCQRSAMTETPRAAAAALYQQAEVHRLRGEIEAAEEAYRHASQTGAYPQPGLALLRVEQGRLDAASAAIRSSLIGITDRLERVPLLPAYIEIMLAAGEIAEAREASRELEETARHFGTEALNAICTGARGTVELAEGDARSALSSLRQALRVWQNSGAVYMAARTRAHIALACSALGDSDGYELELAAARTAFAVLNAAPDLARIESFAKDSPLNARGGLTRRELQVLGLVATGRTNKVIATELFLSEKTIDRHVSNIFVKLGVCSRAAATAFAYEHRLIRLARNHDRHGSAANVIRLRPPVARQSATSL